MTITFLTLGTLEVTHEYYGGLCRDFDFVVPADTAQQLRNGRSIVKALDGRLHVLFEADDGGGPLAGIAGQTLRIGLALRNPYFANYTAPTGIPPSSLAVYRRNAGATQLSAPAAAAPLGSRFAHPLSRTDRPATLSVTGPDGSAVATHTLDAEDTRESVSIELAGRAHGVYTFVEDYPGAIQVSSLGYFHPELTPGVVAVVEIAVDAALYSAPLTLSVAFQARQEPLNYYVVAREHNVAEFNQLIVVDEGAAPKLTFTRIDAAAFTPDEIPAALLGNGEVRIALFRSSIATRQARGRSRIELRRNSEVIVPNLPQPGADRPRADMIVHVSKKP